MALGFGRKKDAADAPDSQTPTPPVSATTPAPTEPGEDENLGQLDLDSFAAELQSGHGLTHEPPLDSALRTPPPNEDDDVSAFDFPGSTGHDPTIESLTEPEPLDLNKMFEVESRQAIASGKIPAPAPYVPASMTDADVPEPETPFYDPQVPVEGTKKKPPILPIVGVLALLLVAGGAAKFFMGGSAPEEAEAPPAVPAAGTNLAPGAPPAPNSPPPVAPPAPNSPPPIEDVAASSSGAPLPPLTPEIQAQLKALWKKGAAAKQAKDYAGARAAWEQALQLRPGHPGFAESIAKLPAPAR